ncbi:MAG: hypothetical protein P8099_20560 [Gemmatimonadota bacterium]
MPDELDALRTANTALTQRVADLEKSLAEATKPPDTEPTVEDLVKSAPPAVQEMLRNAKAEQEAIKAERDAAVAAAAAQEEARLDGEAVTAAEVYKSIGLNPDDLGPALRRLEGSDANLARTIRGALDGAVARGREADLFKSVGSAAASPAGGNAYAEMVSVAKSLVADGTVQTIPQGVAYVAKTNPGLARRYNEERNA